MSVSGGAAKKVRGAALCASCGLLVAATGTSVAVAFATRHCPEKLYRASLIVVTATTAMCAAFHATARLKARPTMLVPLAAIPCVGMVGSAMWYVVQLAWNRTAVLDGIAVGSGGLLVTHLTILIAAVFCSGFAAGIVMLAGAPAQEVREQEVHPLGKRNSAPYGHGSQLVDSTAANLNQRSMSTLIPEVDDIWENSSKNWMNDYDTNYPICEKGVTPDIPRPAFRPTCAARRYRSISGSSIVKTSASGLQGNSCSRKRIFDLLQSKISKKASPVNMRDLPRHEEQYIEARYVTRLSNVCDVSSSALKAPDYLVSPTFPTTPADGLIILTNHEDDNQDTSDNSITANSSRKERGRADYSASILIPPRILSDTSLHMSAGQTERMHAELAKLIDGTHTDRSGDSKTLVASNINSSGGSDVYRDREPPANSGAQQHSSGSLLPPFDSSGGTSDSVLDPAAQAPSQSGAPRNQAKLHMPAFNTENTSTLDIAEEAIRHQGSDDSILQGLARENTPRETPVFPAQQQPTSAFASSSSGWAFARSGHSDLPLHMRSPSQRSAPLLPHGSRTQSVCSSPTRAHGLTQKLGHSLSKSLLNIRWDQKESIERLAPARSQMVDLRYVHHLQGKNSPSRSTNTCSSADRKNFQTVKSAFG
ncbi:AaceriAEL180Cp [[Ashbya] aceris (nom. inval.)]|nr:AaceriAEL180Cp [[Ashbya] aceris (nom. inval.)]